MIEFSNVCFSYKRKPVITDFSLVIKRGESISLSGVSGCGKTTVLRLLLGLEKPQKGTISGTEGLRFSVVFQENRLIPQKTVKENIALFSDNEKAISVLTALGLEEFSDSLPHELSGGQKRRVAIARAICHQFDVLVLDEVMNGLDEKNKKIVADVILAASHGKTIIMVTHNEKEADLIKAKPVKL